ncbi:MAG: hypothetical protein B7Y77_02485 [Bradyrhizobium sp. 35-63-5]|nr:MAG: hypothetical protein B7Y77_02485 [Bradyrhizobium sp. 35-63-5]
MTNAGSNGKFLGVLDLELGKGSVKNVSYRLLPVFSNQLKADGEMSALIDKLHAPHLKEFGHKIADADRLLYRRGNFNGTFDDLICDALLKERDAEIALSPGFRWGTSVLPGAPITMEDIHNATAITYPQVYRLPMTGERLKDVLEDVADNLFNPDPYYQQGGDMVRCGGLGYAIDISKPIGQRISNMTLLKSGKAIEAKREYTIAGWASVNEGTQGPNIWDVVERYVAAEKTVRLKPNSSVKISGV